MMIDNEYKLKPNTLAVIALTNEYCEMIENCATYERDSFIAKLLKIIPRIYIAMNDIELDSGYSDYFIEPSLEETVYDQVRTLLSRLFGEEDVYLEVFMEDMKYSETPISAAISENLADMYQEFYNLLHSLKDATSVVQQQLVEQCKENFINYWGQTLCNVLRGLNNAFYNSSTE